MQSTVTVTIPQGRFALAARIEARLAESCPSVRVSSEGETSVVAVDADELTAAVAGDTRWARLRASVQADLGKLTETLNAAQVQGGEVLAATAPSPYAMADALRGVLAKMNALEPGGAWAEGTDHS